ncbi:hypothetical protein PUMCH_004664 [Australozyma saopauloensis]|uniref:SSD domain-containing protein n=1 Tax=Australozyma saopauloensis TaxID=291208 RepID=A0AAX4HFV9_9ASCO|nr:hypothetical protein PUMCH_004664 [[Candida] saopauloensis]
MRWSLLLPVFSLLSVVSSSDSKGTCAIYGNCGKKLVFGGLLPCVERIAAPKPSQETVDLLYKVCGADFPIESGLCCSFDQLTTLELNLKRVDPLISSCPACRKNFYDFFCKFTCSGAQGTFVNVTRTGTAIDTGKEIVAELSIFTDPKYAEQFYDSCKNVKFSATNGYAMDLIGGGAKNYSQFLKFLGDEKPLLGGSPFQINYKYELPPKTPFVLNSGSMKPCDDPEFKCACSDCPLSCPTLPEFRSYQDRCTVAGLPCFSFVVIVLWLLLFAAIGGYHVYLARTKRAQFQRLNQILSGEIHNSENETDDQAHFSSRDSSTVVGLSAMQVWIIRAREWIMDSLKNGFYKLAYFCAEHPAVVIISSVAICLLCCTGIKQLEWETQPVNLWVSENEPALKNLQYFESEFGEWFRIEQLIISNANASSPVLSWDTVQWWFEKELDLQELTNEKGEKVLFDKLCFKPLDETCAIQSFTQYFQGNIAYLNKDTWAQEIQACTRSPVNCLPSFQQPLKPSLLFSDDKVLDSEAFVVTLLINNHLDDEKYTNYAVSYEKALQKWIKKIQDEKPNLNISYSTEVSLEEELNKSTNTDIKIVVVSYIAMFIYASLALGGRIPSSFDKKHLVRTRFQLGLLGIMIILAAVASSVGICAYFQIKSTLIIAEVIPFLILAVGVDNIFLIVHELHVISENNPQQSISERIALSMARIGPSCFISALIQFLMFFLASTVQMPAVRNFAFYSAGAVFINFSLQMTLFISFLTIDQKRLEEGRMDCLPWITVQKQILLLESTQAIEYDFSLFIEKKYSPWLLKPSNKRKIFTAFLAWLGISLALLPSIQLGLDQRLALPADSYLVDYFNSVYQYLNVGPPIFFVVKDSDLTLRSAQQEFCGKFSTCEEFSIANVLEQEYKRGTVSTIAEPASSWLDDFFAWMNPDLDQCCRFEKNAIGDRFCSPYASPRQCVPCYADHEPPYNILMEAFPTGSEFMKFFRQWIEEPSDPCPLGGKAPYSSSISYNETAIKSSYLRTSHKPLRSQEDFIVAYENALRIVDEIKEHSPQELDLFAFSPFYIFFVQYRTIVSLTFTLLAIAGLLIWAVSTLLLGLMRVASILTAVVAVIMVNIGGIMALWDISLNAVSLVNLVICVGLAVEFTVHISRAYLVVNDETDEDQIYEGFLGYEGQGEQDKKTALASAALCKVGGSVLGGITMTKLIGIFILAFTQSRIFEVYYFRMWLSLVAIASVHALVLLPILLSMFGPE